MRIAALVAALVSSSCLLTQDLGHDLPGAGGSGGSSEPPDVSCVGHVEIVSQPFSHVTGLVRVADGVDPSAPPVDGAIVRVCALTDLDCVAPLFDTRSGPDGAATIEMPLDPTDGFVGYVEVGDAPAFMNLYHVAPAIREQGFTVYAGVYGRKEEMELYAAVDRNPDPARGTIGVQAGDCSGGPSAGLTLELEEPGEETRVLYLELGSAAPARTATDPEGIAVLLDVPPGLHVVRSRSGDVVIGEARVAVRAGAFTTFFLNPTPLP